MESLLKRDESGRLSGTNTSGTVLHRLVGDGELTQVVGNHVCLDLHLVENLAIVHADNRANHLREDDHVAQVSLNALRLLSLRGVAVLLGSTKTLEEGIVLPLQAMLETTTSTGVHKVHELSHGHHEKVLEVDSAVGVLAEGFLFWCVLSTLPQLLCTSYMPFTTHAASNGRPTTLTT